MNLPSGVTYQRLQDDHDRKLISKEGKGLINIDINPPHQMNKNYTIKDRTFDKALAPYLIGDWEDFDRLFNLIKPPAMYSGAEYGGDLIPKVQCFWHLTRAKMRQSIQECCSQFWLGLNVLA